MVNYLCWDLNGDLLASVSEDSVRVWSLNSGECIHELNSNGNQFHSCVFHPSYSALLVIGGLRVINISLSLLVFQLLFEWLFYLFIIIKLVHATIFFALCIRAFVTVDGFAGNCLFTLICCSLWSYGTWWRTKA